MKSAHFFLKFSLEMAEEIFRQLLHDLLGQNATIVEDQKKAISLEISQMDLSSAVTRDLLKPTLGAENIDGAWRSALARSAATLDNPNERHLPKALCVGGDVGLLSGVDLLKERHLLAAILRRAKKDNRAGSSLVSVLEICNLFPSLTPPAAEAAGSAATAVIARLIAAASKLKADRLQAESNPGNMEISSLNSHPAFKQTDARVLRLVDFLTVSKSQGGNFLLPWLRDRFESRLLSSAQARVLSG
jgi:hypothetical protein